MAAGKGKIARLPFEIRQDLNHRMRNGEPDVAILAWLNSLPAVKAALREARFGGARPSRATVSAQNLSDYRAGAYAAWLREQDRVENVKALSEFAFRLAEAAGGDVSRPAVAIAAGKIMEALEGATFDGEAGEGADVVKISAALAGLSVAESAARRVQIAGKRVALQERTVSLDEQRFQRQTCELFIKWYDDRRAREIADGKGSPDVKIDQLRTLMFGAPAAPGEAQP